MAIMVSTFITTMNIDMDIKKNIIKINRDNINMDINLDIMNINI